MPRPPSGGPDAPAAVGGYSNAVPTSRPPGYKVSLRRTLKLHACDESLHSAYFFDEGMVIVYVAVGVRSTESRHDLAVIVSDAPHLNEVRIRF